MGEVQEKVDPSLTCRNAVKSCFSPTSSFVAKSTTCMIAKVGSVAEEPAESVGVAMVREQSKDTDAMVM